MKNHVLTDAIRRLVLFSVTGCIVSIITVGAQAQTISPSADGSALAKAINIPVNHYTGVAGVTIPLYNIESHGIKIPIAIHNQCSGIKKNDEATWVGLGWTLSAGGQVTRIVRGKPDDLFYSSDIGLRGYPDARYMSRLNSAGAVLHAIDNRYDGEADLFYFETPTASGMFVCDSSGVAHTIPYQPIKIEWVERNYFHIVDASGNEYYLGSKESSRENMYVSSRYYREKDRGGYDEIGSEVQYLYTSSWKLDRIVSPAGNSVKFNYVSDVDQDKTRTVFNLRYMSTITDPDHPVALNENKEKSVVRTITYAKRLKEIVWDAGRLEFLTTNDRIDYPGAARLSTIKVYSGQSEYLYGISLSQIKLGAPRNCHSLSSIQQVNGSVKRELYRFEYYPVEGYDASKINIDLWGYYNNSAQNYEQIPIYYEYGIYCKKKIDLAATRWNSLKRIIYPTGACKEFEYENNSGYGGNYYETYSLDTTGGLRIKSITDKNSVTASSGNVTSYEYLKEDGTSSGQRYEGLPTGGWVERYTGNNEIIYIVPNEADPFLFDLAGVSTAYSRVKETLPNGGYNIYNYSSFSDAPDMAPYIAGYRFDSNNQYEPKDLFHRVPKTSFAYKRGLLQSKKVYDAQNNPVAQESYSYDFNAGQIKSIVESYLAYAYPISGSQEKMYCAGTYQWTSQPVQVSQVTISEGKYNQQSSTQNTYDPVYGLLTKTVQTDKEGNTYQTETKYPGQYQPDNSAVGMAIKYMLRKHIIAVPIEQVSYKNGKIVGGTLNICTLRINGCDTTLVVSETRQLALNEPLAPGQFTASGFQQSAFIFDSRYEQKTVIPSYDEHGQIITSRSANGTNTSVLYGYGNSLVTASIINAVRPNYANTLLSSDVTFSIPQNVKTGSVTIPFSQKVKIEVQHTIGTDAANLGRPIILRINNTKTGEENVQALRYLYNRPPSNKKQTFELYLDAGTYTFSFGWDTYFGDYTPPGISYPNDMTITCTYYTWQTPYQAKETVFYTSFEELSSMNVPNMADAKTGRQARRSGYSFSFANFEPGTYTLSYWSRPTSGGAWTYNEQTVQVTETDKPSVFAGSSSVYIDELRVHPSGARMTTTSYIPGIGKTSESDENGRTVYYEYDGFGELKAVRDNDRNLIESHEYHYAK